MSAITVNGEARSLTVATLSQLLTAEGVDTSCRFVAVARNERVVPARAWDETRLAAGDRIEIVRPVQGG